ncbi:fused PTS fructose transporter subunit IIA/HPr protein [uncultured Endozoicomonas sp.]|uniref:fused PTS fructose transporter subunit IIA/HPr protein n=1 Tax=uncultured Endozoicomonas sp. TaxID=432652 RepID=UPI0026149E40|nr:fused PTS fructose transporter subunit IIA/HPr protein [uncultured Endozoicomonas sp.]
MLTITERDIVTGQKAPDKQQAITMVAEGLVSRGLVAGGYGQGMQQRELQAATYLGNGIAIPHGTVETRDQVLKTGVQVMQFPDGVVWGDNGQKAYVVIGIAAGSDEHLGILKQLTRILSVADLENQLKAASTAEAIALMLNGQEKTLHFNANLIDRRFPARSMIEVKAASAGLLSYQKLVDSQFVSLMIAEDPVYLGEGFWLLSPISHARSSAMTFLTVADEISFNGLPVKALLTIAVGDDSCTAAMENLSTLIVEKDLAALLSMDSDGIVATFTAKQNKALANAHHYTILNSHGLHARPSAMFVHAIKGLNATVKVANATEGNGEFVDGRVMSNVMGLGLAKGHQLAVVVDGPDGGKALAAIKEAIASGLGEAVA